MNIINSDRLNVDAREMLEKMEREFGEKVIEFEKKSGVKIKDIRLSRMWTGKEKKPEANAYFTEDNEDETDAIRFTISKVDRKRIKEWYLSLIPEIMSKLKEILKEEDYNMLTNEGKRPYYGSICGPSLIYSFGETGIGEIIKVRETITGRELDLSDYDNW